MAKPNTADVPLLCRPRLHANLLGLPIPSPNRHTLWPERYRFSLGKP